MLEGDSKFGSIGGREEGEREKRGLGIGRIFNNPSKKRRKLRNMKKEKEWDLFSATEILHDRHQQEPFVVDPKNWR